jgi:hypothetical protein
MANITVIQAILYIEKSIDIFMKTNVQVVNDEYVVKANIYGYVINEKFPMGLCSANRKYYILQLLDRIKTELTTKTTTN